MSEIIEMEGYLNSLQVGLLDSLKNDNCDEFVSNLSHVLDTESIRLRRMGEMSDLENQNEDANIIKNVINHFYGDPENKTLLDIACSNTDRAWYVKHLLTIRVDANRINPSLGEAPIHLAVLHSDFDTVKALTEDEHVDIHQPNAAGKTALYLAAQGDKKGFIELLQKRQAVDIEKRKRKFWKHEGGDRILEYFCQIELFPYPPAQSFADFILKDDYEKFVSEANAYNVHRVDEDLKFTWLQYACKLGRTRFVQFLLDFHVDPNETTESHRRTPIMIAAYHGYHDIVQLLMATGIITYDLVDGENLLHSIMHGFYYQMRTHHSRHIHHDIDVSLSNQDFNECLKLILNNVLDSQLNVNLADKQRNTPLFYAIVMDERDMILRLLERGAYIGVQAWNGYSIALIKLFQPATLEYFLNKSTHVNLISPIEDRDDHSRMKFNYELLSCDQQRLNDEPINETKPLVALSEVPELRPLLKHPFFLVYLDFKWHIMVRKLFYVSLALFILLVASLSIYLLEVDYVASGNKGMSASPLAGTCGYVVAASNSIIFLREFTQFIIYTRTDKYRYIKDANNWKEITLILANYVILFVKIESIQFRALCAATVILLSYVELMLLILSHFRKSVHIKMFKTVAWNSATFLMSYLLLIAAFTFTFYILYEDANWDKFFANISEFIFTSLLASTGQYELSTVLARNRYSISMSIFLLFVFLIPVVLLNLLNAIAVNDIQGIRNDAELVSIAARVQSMAHLEEIISASFSFFDSLALFFNTLFRRQLLGHRKWGRILEKQYYYTNHLGTVDNHRKIRLIGDRHCKIGERGSECLEFPISPSTVRSIREKLSAESSKKERRSLPHNYKSDSRNISSARRLQKANNTEESVGKD